MDAFIKIHPYTNRVSVSFSDDIYAIGYETKNRLTFSTGCLATSLFKAQEYINKLENDFNLKIARVI